MAHLPASLDIRRVLKQSSLRSETARTAYVEGCGSINA